MAAEFVHLHVHSHYSLLDGAIKLPDLFRRAAEFDMPAVALTDHGNLHGAIEFYTLAQKAGIKPIIGCEVYVAPGDRRDKELRSGQPANNHLVLLAENETGYRNLLKIVTDAWIHGFYYKPRTDLEVLSAHAEGLIALSACLHGRVAWLLGQDRPEEAREAAGQLADIFGRGNFYIELQDAGLPEQQAVNPHLLKLANDLDLPAVATNDCHYLFREDARAHEALLAIQTGKTLYDDNRLKFSTDLMYFRSPEEMVDRYRYQPELTKNTLAVAERCRVEIELQNHHFPLYPLPEGKTAEDVIRLKAAEGLEERLERLGVRGEEAQRYRERLTHELDVICQMGFAGYFLVVADFIGWAKEHGIPVGPGRGSAAGSLVAYAMRITDIEPIRYGLLFERFLNPERVSMPDIDVDFCFEQRDKVIGYVTERYGAESVAQITTYGTMKAKAVIRDVGRALGMPYGEVDKIAKLVPDQLKMTLKKALEQEPRLAEMRQNDPKVDELMGLAERLEGLYRHASTHAAGVVIADKPLVEYLPLYKDANGKMVTQFDMNCVEQVGLIKFDFLGLRTLTVIDTASRLIRQAADPDFDIDNIPMDDAETFELLSRGDTTGVFQLESSGMKDLLVRLKPSVFEDIIALVALYRPGPMELIPDYIDRKHGRQKVTYPHPDLEPVLKETYGIIVYQEQVMAIANILAGYSLGQADILRRAMGKKKVEVMEKERAKFIEGAKALGHSDDLASSIFDLIAKFAGYGFNKSHAAAYGLIAYQTAYLKAHYPVQFMAAQLTSWSSNSDQVVAMFAECKNMGLEVLPPDVNASLADFGVDGQAIRFGLAAVKNVGAAAIEAILEARAEGPFRDIFDFCGRVDLSKVNKRVIESLIKCGAFDGTPGHRAQLMAVLDEAVKAGQQRQREEAAGQFSLFEAGPAIEAEAVTPDLPNVEVWPEQTRLAYEKESLGFYVSGHPLARFEDEIRRFAQASLAALTTYPEGAQVIVGGVSAAKKEINTKKGDRMAFVQLEDLTGRVEMVVLPNIFLEARQWLEDEEPILVKGVVKYAEAGVVSLKALEIIPLSQAPEKLSTDFRVRVMLSEYGREHLERLKAILSEHPGSAPVWIHLRQPGKFEAVVSAEEDFTVKPSYELYTRVRELLGPESII